MKRRIEWALGLVPGAAWWQSFGHHVWRRFLEDECLRSAGMLAYTTLLAIVPLTAVTLAVISAFPVFEQWSGLIQQFIFTNFVPAAGQVVQEYVTQFADKATELTAAGVLFLVGIAVMLMWNVERTLNRIWRVTTPRRLVNRFMVYWSALSLGPLLIGASLAISSYLVSLPLVSDAASTLGLRSRLIHVAPFVASLAAFTLTLLDLYRAGGFGLPMPSEEPAQDDAWNRSLFDALSALTEPAERHLGGPLDNLYKG